MNFMKMIEDFFIPDISYLVANWWLISSTEVITKFQLNISKIMSARLKTTGT